MQPPPPLSGIDEPEPPSDRTRVRRRPARGRYDESTIYSILDEAFVCHVGFLGDEGPVVLPTAYARVGDELFLHGAAGSAMLRSLASGSAVCVTATIVDGLVLARSAFHHSINYRSVVIFGTAAEVTDSDKKRDALAAIVDHLVPGRSDDARPPNDVELLATRVIAIGLAEASAKVRTGGPIDDPEDLELRTWAGQIPLELLAGAPIDDVDARVIVGPPDYATQYARRHRSS